MRVSGLDALNACGMLIVRCKLSLVGMGLDVKDGMGMVSFVPVVRCSGHQDSMV